MLCAAPPRTRTLPPGRCSSAGTMHRHASARLSLAAATRRGSRPSGTRTSMWSAKGMRSTSATIPPHEPLAGPNPNAARVLSRVVAHFAVMPRRHSMHSPHETDHGTTTTSPRRTPVTSAPTSRTSATHVPDRERSLKRHRSADRADDGVDEAYSHANLHGPRHISVNRHRVAVATLRDERPHQRVTRVDERGRLPFPPFEPASADEGQFTHRPARLGPTRQVP